jgi:hypothetical protein
LAGFVSGGDAAGLLADFRNDSGFFRNRSRQLALQKKNCFP